MDSIYVKNTDKGTGVYAKRAILPNTTVGYFNKVVFERPSKYTVQFSMNVHLEPKGNAKYFNHSCANNNVAIDFNVGKFYTTVTILPDQELTFNYNTTEYDLSCPFKCECGYCNKQIVSGFKHLSDKQRRSLFGQLSPFIKTVYLMN